VRKDLPDLYEWMLATGVRIGEALAVSWEEVDLVAGTVAIEHTVVRITGVGLLRKGTKSSAGIRTLLLPAFAVAMLRRRKLASGGRDPVFPDPQGAGGTRRTPAATCAPPGDRSNPPGSPATRSARRRPPNWIAPGCPRAKSPISSATRKCR
jgi:integrase